MSRYALLALLALLAVKPTSGARPTPKDHALALFPVLAYLPETGGIGGVFAQLVAGGDSLDRPDQAAAWLTVAVKGQVEVGIRPECWLANNRWNMQGEVSYQHWPAGWHGVGPDSPRAAVDFTAERLKLELRLRRRLAAGLYGGVHALRTRESFSAFDSTFTRGDEEGVDAGMGFELVRDTRDDTIWPTSGMTVELRAMRHGAGLGGDWSYTRWQADLRGYRSLGLGALAAQFAVDGRGGQPGFRALPRLGEWLRAVDDMRFIDRWAGAGRLEWRQPLPFTLPTRLGERLSRRAGVVFFTEAGQVGPEAGDLLDRAPKLSLGLGGRFALLPRERVNVRADLAFGREGVALRIKVGEEF